MIDPLDKSIISLSQIANWLTKDNSNLRELIKKEINEKTHENVADEILQHEDQVVGGTPDHRAKVLRIGNSAHINYEPTVATPLSMVRARGTSKYSYNSSECLQ